MAWTAPASFSVGEVLASAKLNIQLRDNLRFLKGLDGTVTIDNSVNLFTPSTGSFATVTLSLGDSGTTARAQLLGQRDGTNAGGYLIANTRDGSGTLVEAWRVNQQQYMGVGSANPLTRLHLRDGGAAGANFGNASFWSATNIGTTPVTVIPSGVTAAHLMYIVISSSNLYSFSTATLISGSNPDIFNANNNADRLIAELSGGALTVRRSAGSLTYRTALWILWF
ncbi:MAG: hypothetical protein OHK0022_28010 [Roseiflexaceae bacterium]